MSQETNTELLKEILRCQQGYDSNMKDLAKRQLDFAAEVSTFINRQAIHNSRIRSFLESDSATKQEGLIEKVGRLEGELNVMKVDDKKRTAFMAGAGMVAGTVLVPSIKWLGSKLIQLL